MGTWPLTRRDPHRLRFHGQYEQRAVDREPVDESLGRAGVRGGGHDDLHAAECLEGLGLVDLGAVDELVRAEAACHGLFGRVARERDHPETHRRRELQGEVSEAAVFGLIGRWTLAT